ncbi:MAG TPA: ROK family protein [Chloroflexota bacterium]|nr:ROK family protein [Chloroflexota bacterium]
MSGAEQRNAEALALGVDIGGTKVAAVVVDGAGTVLASERGPVAPESNDSALASVVAVVDRVLETQPEARGRLVGIGAGAPGGVDWRNGVLLGATNLAWRNLPLGEELSKRYGVPALVDNDVNVAAWGERCFGGWGRDGKQIEHLVFITVGTGIGSGLIENGRIVRGRRGAGEIGHIPVLQNGPRCKCGMVGCLEGAASGPALGAAGRRLAESGESPRLVELAGGAVVTAAHVVQAAVEGYPGPKMLLQKEGEYLALATLIASRMLDPEVIVIGGGLAEAGDPLFQSIWTALRKIRERGPEPETYVVPTRLGGDAGAIGAAALVLMPEGGFVSAGILRAPRR